MMLGGVFRTGTALAACCSSLTDRLSSSRSSDTAFAPAGTTSVNVATKFDSWLPAAGNFPLVTAMSYTSTSRVSLLTAVTPCMVMTPYVGASMPGALIATAARARIRLSCHDSTCGW